MGNVVKVDIFVKCYICKKRKATALCDMTIGKGYNFHLKDSKGFTDYENSFQSFDITCDKPVCDKCSKKIGYDKHVCKICFDKMIEK